MVPNKVNGHVFRQPLSVLFDTGSRYSYISPRAVPADVRHHIVPGHTVSTLTGERLINRAVDLTDCALPQFSPTLKVSCPIRCYVNARDTAYDIILGREALFDLGISVSFTEQLTTWTGISIPFQNEKRIHKDTGLLKVGSRDDADDFIVPSFASTIMESSYESFDIPDIVKGLSHLSKKQIDDLVVIFKQCGPLFSNKLRDFKGPIVTLKLKPGARPSWKRPYAVPQSQLVLFKNELDRLVAIGVLEPCGASPWAAPTFIIPKKDGRVRWISDFRELNKFLERRPYPIPVIHEMLRKRKGYKFFTKLDISMQFYTYLMDEASRELCTIGTPFGMYRYRKLPMGLTVSPDIAQETMKEVLADLPDVEVYIDDIGIFVKIAPFLQSKRR